ncbi:uncharacterized protein F4812DRAFT_441948 [Daldinia caldariorum]|uniref:uncharacterized protein n=1 Tax=Daldinia caldariorum TaxID=326644 RepID=UPI0020080951|nr:uncharacterized protein F4812DRAFT_441948 [Daldinia caldariorum]KAI1464761.1 hypothetical protein F4812DRAFT_441948 [Daldinia caldariorum]
MIPRKRAKPNPSTRENSDASQVALPSQSSLAPGQSMPPTRRDSSKASASKSNRLDDIKQVRKPRSWYGSWSQVPKSSASTQVSHQTIMGGTLRPVASPDFSRFETKKDNGSVESDGQSTGTLPKTTEAPVQPGRDDNKSAKAQEANNSAGGGKSNEMKMSKDQEAPNATANKDEIQPSAETTQLPQASSSWLGWFGRSAVPEATTQKDRNAKADSSNEPESMQLDTPQPPSEPSELSEPPKPPEPNQTPAGPVEPTKPTSSWFGFWYTSTTPAASENSTQKPTDTSPVEESLPNENQDVTMEDAPASKPTEVSQSSYSSTWAFWSRDTGQKGNAKTTSTPEAGELAIMGDGSEANPKRSTSAEVGGSATPVKEPPTKTLKEPPIRANSSKKSKRARPQSMNIGEQISRPGTPQSDVSVKTVPSKLPVPEPSKPSAPNLLLPSFRNTYRMKNNPSIVKQITQLLLRTQQPPANHVFLVKEAPKIKKAVVIGIHGLFPASYLRPMIGQPTGTSIRFANHGAEAIRRWAESHGCGDCKIEKVALEGEGKIADRVDNLWKLLLNWIEHIRGADLIVLACHSQGVPVGLMLLEKLIDLGIITNSKIGVCAMAGVSLGPFPDYKSSMGRLMGTAAELWQFADPESEVSKRYQHAVEAVVNYGARITYIGSIDDQLVPMDSAIYAPASHPYIYRAVFIDGRIHAPDFIAHLVGFALKLRNLGISDHGLIRELSIPLAGSLYSGEGHSRLYDDEQVYDLAISHALETTSVTGVPCQIQRQEKLANPNPFMLPWIMRGLLEEEFVKTELYSETTELLKQFDNWSPSTKALKDVKYRLEVIRSKL